MKLSRILLISSICALLVSCTCRKPCEYINPMIGTGGHGHTYPGPGFPFGMIQLSPDTREDGWDGCSGYHITDTIIYGFSHTHLSGTGCSDYGDILVMPVTGNPGFANHGFSSGFRRSTEKAEAGYYKVDLERYHIQAELTSTARTGFHRYTFPESEKAAIIFDLKYRDKVLDSYLKVVSDSEIVGMRVSQAWADKQIIYFAARFSKPFQSVEFSNGHNSLKGIHELSGDSVYAAFHFTTKKDEKILVKVGISAVSEDGARKNMETEIPGWDFDKVRKAAQNEWNKELGKITVKGGSEVQKTVFYTALYHAMLNPNLYMDVDHKYRGRDLKVHSADSFDYYTVFSLWDTYRAAHPLYTLIEQKRTRDFINTFLKQYQEGGMLPVWELSGNETGCMIGYHSVPVIVDAYVKGIRGFDPKLALEAMKHSANQDHLGLSYYRSEGYIPGDKESESVSKTLEYAYDDWCIAQMAKATGDDAGYHEFIHRAQYYKNLFDLSSGFMRAKMNGTWFSPFDPAEVNFNYTEANSWQYSFYVPQDVTGLIGLMGGKEKFLKKLDQLFSVASATTGRNQADISGMIGQYAHGNEPSHHMAYLYDYAGEPWKTQELIHRIVTTLYNAAPDGLCGNEDCGQMSSWLIMSALGFYPVCPGSLQYAIGTPMFPEITIHLENGKTFTVKAKKISDRNFYIQSAKLNGQNWTKCFIDHNTILAGGTLELTMGDEPRKSWGTAEGDYPTTAITDDLITPVPSLSAGKTVFLDSTAVKLTCVDKNATILYSIDGQDPLKKGLIYSKPLIINKSLVLKAIAVKKGSSPSFPISANFIRIPEERKITLNTKYSPQYSAGGDLALVDFIKGSDNFRTGTWQGYEGVNLDAVVDLGSEQTIHLLSTGFLQDQSSWIFMPVRVEYSISTDGKEYTPEGMVNNEIPEKQDGPVIKEFKLDLKGVKARYIHVVGVNRKVCPSWNVGAGNKSWIFADEITVK
ncbi:MAG: GH92 family glycosyl hydrolase [Bacteroidota bacterium]|nr:GH92 family glycosyl hydrolase [Bacteroidota bacterium]